MLKGPLKVDGDLVYTKSQMDAAILAEREKIKKDFIENIINWPALADAELLYNKMEKLYGPIG
ncbi:hypothetical protein [Bartonella machadoae]|uniref:hypothetical protein n=1 Tax=Bartonella machadoae TaxID=2893471 RepID=UPI001F4C89BB|nr:hypothetical protein [Bartonella machadoae]UNE54636.1 hypothetical protein LNM86_01710 [Bartonella machadoae]